MDFGSLNKNIEKSGSKWFKVGNIFITLHHKLEKLYVVIYRGLYMQIGQQGTGCRTVGV